MPSFATGNPLQLILRDRKEHLKANLPLFDTAATRGIEQAAQAMLPPHTLMQRAGLSSARLAMAMAPHADSFWIACGPGNNGGDGFEAALHLKQWGKSPIVTGLGAPAKTPLDAAQSRQRAIDAGVAFADSPPAQFDFCIDAILGIGASNARSGRDIEGDMATWIALINSSSARVLAVDVPTGLHADTGIANAICVRANATLSLMTLKPGLFTANGRDACGEIWLDALVELDAFDTQDSNYLRAMGEPSAWLASAPIAQARAHATHKGSYGDVLVIGGAPGMTGAALLAATAALQFGAGRVFVMLIDGGSTAVDFTQPELMFRPYHEPLFADQFKSDFANATVVCGCGGGSAVRGPLHTILASNANAVLDADALNAMAYNKTLSKLLSERAARKAKTVLTPHPLEAARLLTVTTQEVQQNRLAAATALARQFNCTVVLKGSGTVIAAPGKSAVINPTGNALLASAGTGDVLAGMVGARLAGLEGLKGLAKLAHQSVGHEATDSATFQAVCEAVYLHGKAADQWPAHRALTASSLARAVCEGIF